MNDIKRASPNVARPLAGISVLEITAGLAGPFCGAWLADLGADVVKIEPPGTGERTRGTLVVSGVSPFFVAGNRGKRSLTVDITQAEGVRILQMAAGRSDVLLNNFKPGALERRGLKYGELQESNPGLIWVQGTGYGSLGPKAEKGAVDLSAQAAGGLASVTGTHETGPILAGASIADMTLALSLFSGVLAALYARERTGIGERVEASLVGGQLVLQSTELAYHSVTADERPRRSGRGHYLFPPTYACYPTRDGHLAVAGVGDWNWELFCDLLSLSELATDERFDTPEKRGDAREILTPILENVFCRRSTAEWEERLAPLNKPTSPVVSYEELLEDEQYRVNHNLSSISDPDLGEVTVVCAPIRFSRVDVRPRETAPQVGQHSEEVLLELGFDWPEILRLRESGVV